MARPLRIEYPGALYHITARGNQKNDIYLTSSDRYHFLDILEKTVSRYNWICHAYCLMNNHYHLMIETLDANLSEGMRQLNGVYTQYFNRSNHSVGHLFQGRFKSILVEKDSYLLELCRYIVCNPVRAHVCRAPEDWKWSSYNPTAYGRNVPDFLATDWVLNRFSDDISTAQKMYKEFVQDGLIKGKSPLDDTVSQVVCGSEAFVSDIHNKFMKSRSLQEIPRGQRLLDRPALSELIAVGGDLTKQQRNDGICKAHLNHGYKLKEIADHLDIHYATVSRVLAKKEKM